MEYASLPTSPSILKAALRTARKLLENDSFKSGLLLRNFEVGKHLKALYASKIDHDHDQEEVILLLIQKIVVSIVASYFEHLVTDEDKLGCCQYLLKVLRKRALSDSVTSSLHMSEGTKRNVNKLFCTYMRKDDRQLKL